MFDLPDDVYVAFVTFLEAAMKISAFKNLLNVLQQQGSNASSEGSPAVLSSTDVNLQEAMVRSQSNPLQNLDQAILSRSKINQTFVKQLVQQLLNQLTRDQKQVLKFLLGQNTIQNKSGSSPLSQVFESFFRTSQSSGDPSGSSGPSTAGTVQGTGTGGRTNSAQILTEFSRIIQQLQTSDGPPQKKSSGTESVIRNATGTDSVLRNSTGKDSVIRNAKNVQNTKTTGVQYESPVLPKSVETKRQVLKQFLQQKNALQSTNTETIQNALKTLIQSSSVQSKGGEGSSPSPDSMIRSFKQQPVRKLINQFKQVIREQPSLKFVNDLIDLISERLDTGRNQSLGSGSTSSSSNLSVDQVVDKIRQLINRLGEGSITQDRAKGTIKQLIDQLSTSKLKNVMEKLQSIQQNQIDRQPVLRLFSDTVRTALDTHQTQQNLQMLEVLQNSSNRQVLLLKIPEGTFLENPGFLRFVENQQETGESTGDQDDKQPDERENERTQQVGIHLTLTNLGTVIGNVRLREQTMDVELYADREETVGLFRQHRGELASSLDEAVPDHTFQVTIGRVRDHRSSTETSSDTLESVQEASHVDRQV